MNKNDIIPYRKYAIVSTLIFLGACIVTAATFFIVDNTFTVPNEYIINLEAQPSCATGDELIRNKAWHYKSFVYLGMYGAGYGGYLGMLIHSKHYGGMGDDVMKNSFWKIIVRYLVLAILAVPFALPFFFVPWTANLYLLLFLKTMLPTFFMLFINFSFHHALCVKLRLIDTPTEK